MILPDGMYAPYGETIVIEHHKFNVEQDYLVDPVVPYKKYRWRWVCACQKGRVGRWQSTSPLQCYPAWLKHTEK